MVEWYDEDELLAKTIGEIREILAHADADETFGSFLAQHGWIEGYEDEDEDEGGALDVDDAWEELDDDYDEEDDDYDMDNHLTDEEQDLAWNIAHDIANGAYTLDNVRGMYEANIIQAIEEALD